MIRPLEQRDLPQLAGLWQHDAADLERAAEEAAGGGATEHHAMVSDPGDRIDGIVIYRMIPGAVGAGEIETVAAPRAKTAAELIGAAVEELELNGARIVVAEYAESAESTEYEKRLHDAGFETQAKIAEYFAEGQPLVIAVKHIRAGHEPH